MVPADVQDPASLDALFARVGPDWGRLDVLVHAIAYSDKAELDGRFLDTSRANFLNSLDISCYSLVDLTRRAAPLMTRGGAILTLTYLGAQRVTPHYNVMGVAKAALESAVRYLANDLGPEGIRVNAISPGPMRTLAGAAIAGLAQGLPRDRAQRAAARQRHARGGRRHRGLSRLRPRRLHDRRGDLRRRRLPCDRHGAAGQPVTHSRAHPPRRAAARRRSGVRR